MGIAVGEYCRWDAVEMARLVRAGTVSAGELAETARALAEELGRLNAVAEFADGHDGGAGPDGADGGPGPDGGAGPGLGGPLAEVPFGGVPFAVKELLGWPGLAQSMGSRLMRGVPTAGLSPYAARIAGSGLNVICSTASSEFGLLGSTESALRGPTLNPWGDGLSAGGSSGGSAALVAAGIVPMAHGNDAGGSLRGPAALTGIFGFKPSNRRCAPAWPDDGPGFASLIVDHCMSRSVRDSAAFLAATERVGADAAFPPVGLVTGPNDTRLRIGVLATTLVGQSPDSPVARELDSAVALCERLGHHVETVKPPAVDSRAFSDAYFTAAAAAMAQVSAMAMQTLGRPPGPAELEPFTLELIEQAATFGPDAVAGCERAFADARHAYLALFSHCDVVLSPTLPRVAWPMGTLAPDLGREALIRRTSEIAGYTAVHNVAGCPAMTVPLGRHDGLPVGIHFAARPGADRLLLALAFELEAAAPWADVRPDMAWLGLTGA